MNTDATLWDWEEVTEKREPVADIYWLNQVYYAQELPTGLFQCAYCGEEAQNSYVFGINHGKVFNDWCARRLSMNQRVIGHKGKGCENEIAWLASRGWKAQSPYFSESE
jgi:hypothetical protein